MGLSEVHLPQGNCNWKHLLPGRAECQRPMRSWGHGGGRVPQQQKWCWKNWLHILWAGPDCKQTKLRRGKNSGYIELIGNPSVLQCSRATQSYPSISYFHSPPWLYNQRQTTGFSESRRSMPHIASTPMPLFCFLHDIKDPWHLIYHLPWINKGSACLGRNASPKLTSPKKLSLCSLRWALSLLLVPLNHILNFPHHARLPRPNWSLNAHLHHPSYHVDEGRDKDKQDGSNTGYRAVGSGVDNFAGDTLQSCRKEL